jgi:hypothetical protein
VPGIVRLGPGLAIAVSCPTIGVIGVIGVIAVLAEPVAPVNR